MKLIKRLKIEVTYLTVLFMGAVSTAGGGIWLMLLRSTERGSEYLNAGLEELTFGALTHIIIAVILALTEKSSGNR